MTIMEGQRLNLDNIFCAPFSSSKKIKDMEAFLEKRGDFCAVSGILSSARALFIYATGKKSKHKVMILPSEVEARKLCDEYRFFDEQCAYFPAKDMLFYQSDLRSGEVSEERMKVICTLLSDEPMCVFTTVDALMNKLPPKAMLKEKMLYMNETSIIDVDALVIKLLGMGYERCSTVSVPGEFAVRGGIIDIFPATEDLPIRIELWDDEVDSIRRFDINKQTSVENISAVKVFPASEFVIDVDVKDGVLKRIQTDVKKRADYFRSKQMPKEAYALESLWEESLAEENIEAFLPYFYEQPESLLDYCIDNTLIYAEDPSVLYEVAADCEEEFATGMQFRYEQGLLLEKQKDLLFSKEAVFSKMQSRRGVYLSLVNPTQSMFPTQGSVVVDSQPVLSFQGSIPLLKREIANYKKKKYKIVLLGMSRTRSRRLAEDLQRDGINCYYSEEESGMLKAGQVLVTRGYMHKGVDFSETRYVFISESDIFGEEKKQRRKKKYKSADAIKALDDLRVGDYVIHENYGLGIYRGLEKIEHDRVIKDYVKISYAKEDNLYVQVTQLDLITKYQGAKGTKPKLSSLNNKEWSKTKSRVQQAVGVIAKDLVDLYAVRENTSGYAYGPDTVWQQEFEETFPFEETRGQLEAIADVKSDLMSAKIMDRLICGDVGYGKTEIAIRASFKVIQENKQVVYLCPTTILAQQHYQTFVSRMKNFPVNIGMLSRFRTSAQNEKTIKELKDGALDIVIGTHRILSKDVGFKDLGLLIIDEEQRFGVSHKEKIKKMKKSVDVLSLTATPIPRTLHMSLVGIRDMSILDEAPLERLPVQTYVFEYNEELVREAISRELSRGGQVYYVVNRIRRIADIAARIESLVPKAHVVYAHGQMPEQKLEQIMADFVSGEIDVLVATTIIEIGLDISNVNTILIHDADAFGLSQLYQLRGRVGRSSRRAYAFLMYQKDKLLKEVALKRLTAISEFTELGSGFKIAMRDLEIRGAGNLLGIEQHGHMDAVGYDLYLKMLANAVYEEKTETKNAVFETVIDLNADAYLPPEYIPDEVARLDLYKRISFIGDIEAKEAMIEECIDRFGDPPKAVIHLVEVAYLRSLAHTCYLTKVMVISGILRANIYPQAVYDSSKIPELLDIYKGNLRLQVDKEAPTFLLRGQSFKNTEEVFTVLKDFLHKIKEFLLENVD